MSESREHKRRYNQRLEYIAHFTEWLEKEPPMNNVAYVRVLLDCFSAAQIASGKIVSIEAHYAAPCLEGELK